MLDILVVIADSIDRIQHKHSANIAGLVVVAAADISFDSPFIIKL